MRSLELEEQALLIILIVLSAIIIGLGVGVPYVLRLFGYM